MVQVGQPIKCVDEGLLDCPLFVINAPAQGAAGQADLCWVEGPHQVNKLLGLNHVEWEYVVDEKADYLVVNSGLAYGSASAG